MDNHALSDYRKKPLQNTVEGFLQELWEKCTQHFDFEGETWDFPDCLLTIGAEMRVFLMNFDFVI